MEINVYATQNSFEEKDLKEKVVVIVDVLRATSTIITALYNGCKGIIPVTEIEEAMNIARNYERNSFLLGGERNAHKIEGFHLSNSPSEYTRGVVEGTTIMLTTTNGTRAIKKAEEAKKVIIAGILNVTAVAEYLMELDEDVTFVCAGTDGKFSLDDILTVGAIISTLANKGAHIELDDLAMVARQVYESNSNDIRKALENTYHYKKLASEGLTDDIVDCLRLDAAPVVPIYHDGIVRRLENIK